MIKYLVFGLLIFIFLSCHKKPLVGTAKRIAIDTMPQILIAGLGDITRENIQNLVAKKYGFKFLRVGVCVVSRQLADSMRIHNEILYKKLENTYGKNLLTKLWDEINSISELQYRVECFLHGDSETIRRNWALGKGAYEMRYEIDPNSPKNLLNINAYDWTGINGDFQKRIYYTISIDTSINHQFR